MKILDLIQPKTVVFDVGANAGSKTAGYLARGARVVCIEPLPWRAQELRQRFAHDHVVVEELAMGSERHTRQMMVCGASDVLSTLEPKWQTGRFKGEKWDRTLEVEVSTLDAMIESYGLPAFIKVDVEGYEKHVLRGLSHKVPCMSVEFSQEFAEDAGECVGLMQALGMSEFTLGTFDRDDLLFDWMPGDRALALIPQVCGGDIYGRAV